MSAAKRTPSAPRPSRGSMFRGSTSRQFLAFVLVVIVGTSAIFGAAALGAFEDEQTQPALPVPGTSGANGEPPATTDATEPVDVPDVAGRTGGTVTLGVPGWPTCLNPIRAECANVDAFHWTIAEHVFPKLMELDARGEYVASPLLLEQPTVANGGITEDPFTVTYRLNPDARWNDGTAITSADVEFTWDAILATNGAFDAPRYDAIVVDASVPDEVVIEFDEPRQDWPELFGGTRGYILQAAGFLNPDLSDEIDTFIGFSGGPWIVESWSSEEAVLVANPSYWNVDRIPRLDRVIFVPVDRPEATPTALVRGDVAVAYRPQTEAILRPDSDTDVEILVGRSWVYDALWWNQRGALADRRVRAALERVVPRSLILRDVVQPQFAEIPLLQCVGWVPTLGSWCLEGDYATFLFDIEGAAQLLDEAGFVVPAFSADGLRVDRDGNPLRFTLVFGDEPFAAEIARVVRDFARFVQIEIEIEDLSSSDLDRRLSMRDYDIALAGEAAHADPSVTDLFACDAIPDASNGFTGGNFVGWCNEGADNAMHALDTEPARSRQVPLVRQIGDFVVSDHVALPLFQRPTLTVWRSDLVEGPIGEFSSSPYSSFWNIFEWEATDKTDGNGTPG